MSNSEGLLVDAGATVDALKSGFRRALADCPERLVESYFTFAGQRVELRTVGRELAARIERPFAHLRTTESSGVPAELLIELWEGSETGISLPSELSAPIGERAEVRVSDSGESIVYARSPLISGLDRRARHMIGWVQSVSRLTLYDRAKPLNLLTSVWCEDAGLQLLHAGMVSDGRGVLFAGIGGSGKSTTTLACAVAGYRFLGDDCVALRTTPGGFEAHSLYASTTLTADALDRLPPFASQAIAPVQEGDEKRLLFPGDSSPIRIGHRAPISVVVLPRIQQRPETSFTRATKTDALLRLAPTSLIKRAVSPREGLSQLARLVDRVPCYWLDVGSDRQTIPARIAQLLSQAAPS